MQSTSASIPRDEFIRRVQTAHHGQVIVGDDYRNLSSRATFIDVEHGLWMTIAGNVALGKGHPARGQQKYNANLRKHEPVPHWYTGKLCHSSSSYEYAVLKWLNDNRYDFDWQPTYVELPTLTPIRKRKVRYTPDLFVKTGPFANTYVEIKGTWFAHGNQRANVAIERWNMFQALFPSSVIWFRKDLIRLGIL